MKTNRNSKIKKKDKKLKSQVIILPNNVLLVKKELLIKSADSLHKQRHISTFLLGQIFIILQISNMENLVFQSS